MNLEKYDFNITKASNDEYILSVNDMNYLVGEIVYNILKASKDGLSQIDILTMVNKKLKHRILTENEFQDLINESIIPILNSQNVIKKENPVKKIGVLLNTSKYISFIRYFNVVFSPVVFTFLFIFLTFFSFYFINTFSLSLTAQSISDWIFALLFTFFIIVFHELGHVVGASKFKITAKEIGYGFYFIYPALYTDLTEIWKLNKKQRIIINLGGMYFQMMINVVLVLLTFLSPNHKNIFISCMFCNMGLILFNLNPFFKFDAYWLFSDFFGIHNLREQSNKVLLSFIKKAEFPNIESKKRIILVIYAVLYALFMILVWILIVKYFYKSSLAIYDLFVSNKFLDFTDLNTIKHLLSFGFTLFFVIRILMRLIKIKKPK